MHYELLKRVSDTLDSIPSTAGEVGDGHGRGTVLQRNAGLRSEAAPFGHIINVHVKRKTFLQTSEGRSAATRPPAPPDASEPSF